MGFTQINFMDTIIAYTSKTTLQAVRARLLRSVMWFVVGMLISSTVLPTPAWAGEAEIAFAKANALYNANNFKQAIEEYERLVAQGYEAAEVYYNLGNAYYKSGNIPLALLNYERAHRLAPDDEDIEFNIAVAQTKVVDKIEPAPRLFIVTWWELVVGVFAADTWGIIAVAAFAIVFLLAALFFVVTTARMKKLLFTLGIVALSLGSVAMVFGFRQYRVLHSTNKAIVFAPSVPVKSAPQEDAKDLFVLHEGTKVEVLETLGEWNKIRIADGSIGWLRMHLLKII
jgi:tetratricopeptide (TPR) repeat protein